MDNMNEPADGGNEAGEALNLRPDAEEEAARKGDHGEAESEGHLAEELNQLGPVTGDAQVVEAGAPAVRRRTGASIFAV